MAKILGRLRHLAAAALMFVGNVAWAQSRSDFVVRVDAQSHPGFGPDDFPWHVGPADFQSDAAAIGLRGPVSRVQVSYEKAWAGDENLKASHGVDLRFDSSGNIIQAEARLSRYGAYSVWKAQNEYEDRDAKQVRASSRISEDDGQVLEEVVFQRDEHGRITRITSNTDASYAIEYAPDGSVTSVTPLGARHEGLVYRYDSAGRLIEMAWRRDREQHAPKYRIAWTDDQCVRVFVTDPEEPELLWTEVCFDAMGSVVRCKSYFMGNEHMGLADRAITRDDHGNWTSITETGSVPDWPDKAPRVISRVTQTIEYRDEAPPAEPKPQP